MRSVDRVLTALELEEPDTVPIGELGYNLRKVSEAIGRSYLHSSQSGSKRENIIETNVGILSEFVEMLDLDLVPVVPSFTLDDECQKWLDRETWIDGWGAKYKSVGYEEWYVGPTIQDITEIENMDFPDPYAVGLTDEAILLVERFKGDRALVGVLPGPKIPYLARGIDGYSIDLFRNFSLAKKFMDLTTDYNVEVGKRLVEAGVDLICITGDVAYRSGPIFSDKHFREVFVPDMKAHVDTFHKMGIPVVKHSDGNLNIILEDLIATGIDGLQSIEPSAGMDIAQVKSLYGSKICLWGNIDLSHTLSLGTLENVQREVKRCISAAAPGGGFILSSSNSYSSAVKKRNYEVLVEVGRKYGKYSP